jgi:hypothetical protein
MYLRRHKAARKGVNNARIQTNSTPEHRVTGRKSIVSRQAGMPQGPSDIWRTIREQHREACGSYFAAMQQQRCLLVRNLRRSLRKLCVDRDICAVPDLSRYAHVKKVTITLDYTDPEEEGAHEEPWSEELDVQDRWRCPVCSLFGAMATLEVLLYHLTTYHHGLRAETRMHASALGGQVSPLC